MRRAPASLLLLLMSLAWQCSPTSRDAPARQTGSTRSNVQARAIWQRHETAIVRALAGEIRGDEFQDACLFFKDTVGLDVRGEGMFAGWVPVPETATDLETLRAWYARNAHLLYVDSVGKVRVGLAAADPAATL